MSPIVFGHREHHCDLHARLVAHVERTSEHDGIPVVVTISSEDAWTRMLDQRDLYAEGTDFDAESTEQFRDAVRRMCRPGFHGRVRAVVERSRIEQHVELAETIWPYFVADEGFRHPTVRVAADCPEPGILSVTVVVEAMDAMLVVPLAMLIVEDLCHAMLWATVTLRTNALPVSASMPSAA